MVKKIIEYLIIFIIGAIITFVFVLFIGKFSSFRAKDPIVLSWNELFSNYLNILLYIPIILGVICVYIKWDNDSNK